MDADVLIIGAGPTGLTLANLLGSMGVQVLVVERNAGTVTEPRAVSIDDESMRAMQAAGLDAQVDAITANGYGSIYRGPDGRPFLRVMPQSRDYGFDKRNAFEQPQLEAVLREGLSRFPNVTAQFETEVVGQDQDDAGVTVTFDDGTTARAAYVIAADGGRSPMRERLDIPMDGSTYEEPWLIVDLASTENSGRHTEVFCNPERSCISLPGPNGIRRYEFKLNKGEDREACVAEPFVRDLLGAVGSDRDCPFRRVQVYTFHARLAQRWRIGRIMLAGDAAHLTPPFAGQGMNSGLRDAHNLAWKLDEVLRGADPVLLDTYEVERRPHAQSMIDLALRMGQVMMPTNAWQGRLVRAGFRVLSIWPPARDYFAQMKYKPKPRFLQGLVWPNDTAANKAITGQLIPQPIIESTDRTRVLMDMVLPDTPVVLIHDADPHRLDADVLAKLQAVGAHIVGLTPEGVNPRDGAFPVYRDASSLFAMAPRAACLGHAILLRRDRYVAAVRPISAATDLLAMIEELTAPLGSQRDVA